MVSDAAYIRQGATLDGPPPPLCVSLFYFAPGPLGRTRRRLVTLPRGRAPGLVKCWRRGNFGKTMLFFSGPAVAADVR